VSAPSLPTPSVHEQAPRTWWSPTYGLIWLDTGTNSYRFASGLAERFALPTDAVPLYEGPPCRCGEC